MITPRIRAFWGRLRRNTDGLALIEFAFSAPILLTLTLTGAELTNYATSKMRVSQVALHLADHAARLGEGSPLAAKQVSERDLNDVLTGAGLQAGELNLYAQGRVVLSSLEPMANPNPTGRYKIAWQRCRGAATYAPRFGVANQPSGTDMVGMGPSLIIAPDAGATMFVEVYYRYKPLIKIDALSTIEMREVAAMPVRDRRDTTQIYNDPIVTQSLCT